jgi:beta-N-acetylhexosaminidase
MLSARVLLPLPAVHPSPPPPPPVVRSADVVIGALGGVGSEGSRLVLSRHPGGLVLFGELRDGGDALRAALRKAKARPVVMIDQEGGLVRRVRTIGPSAPTILRLRKPRATELQFRDVGLVLHRMGVHVNLAPVADIDAGGATGFRSFGRTPGPAGLRVAAAVRGLRAGGIAGCVKHFPGLGTVRTNTDNGVAVDRRPLSAVTRDLAAFRSGIAAGVRCVMVSSVVVPALCRRPAMLCPQTYARLRKMGFRGAIVTDSLDADALRPYGSVGAVAVKALAAGADSVLVTSPWSTLKVIDAVTRATTAGRLDPARLKVGATRLRALR